MPRMPHDWLNTLTAEDKKAADELADRIDEAIDKGPPSHGSRNHFQYDFDAREKIPNKHVQDEIKRRYQKSTGVPKGWSKVEFHTGGGRQDGGGSFIRFDV